MSRRTKWFQLNSRQGSSSSRTAKRAGRTLGFEHCEPRIALSVNGAGDTLYFTTGAYVSEGGLIGFDVSPTGQGEFNFMSSSGAIRSVIDRADLVLTATPPQVADVDDNHVISVGEFFSDESKVQQIAAPVGGVLQPEGGQIVIIEAPHSEMAALAHAESEVAGVRTSRPLLDSSAAGSGVGQHSTLEVEGLRGRAIVFEVAHAKMNSSGRRAGAQHDDSDSELAVDGAVAALAASRVDAAYDSTDKTANRSAGPGDSSPPDSRSTSRSWHVAESAPAMPRHGGQTLAHVVARRSLVDAQSSLDAEAVLDVRDAALEHWASAAAAPLANKEPAQELGAPRSRRVLALALVLTVGAGPVSRLFRRRAPVKVGHEQPCERPKPLDLA